MEIKRKLVAASKLLSPQIEAMNIGPEISEHIDRIIALCKYGQEKLDRAGQREEAAGVQTAKDRKAAEQVITDAQLAESDKNLADQKEAYDERNDKNDMRLGRGKPTPELSESLPTSGNVTKPVPEKGKKETKKKSANTTKW